MKSEDPWQKASDHLYTKSIKILEEFRIQCTELQEFLSEKRADMRSEESPTEEEDRAAWFLVNAELKLMGHRWKSIDDLISDSFSTSAAAHEKAPGPDPETREQEL